MHAKCTIHYEGENLNKKVWGGHSPSPDPLPLGRGYPPKNPIGAYGASILSPSALDPGWTNFANRTLIEW